jgi:hypothetical protein
MTTLMSRRGDFFEAEEPEAAGDEVIFQGNKAVGPTVALCFLCVGGGGLLEIA